MALAIYNYCNPYSDQEKYKTFIINGDYVKILQQKENGIGYTIWDCVRDF
jgi:hypothetical protein